MEDAAYPKMIMNRIKLFASISAFALIVVACGGGSSESADAISSSSASPAPAAPAGDPAPTNSFDTFSGETVTLAQFAGRPVVLNFWASWCPSCVAEMSAAFKPVEEDLGDEITFIGMNIQDDRALADRLLAQTGVEWVAAEDPAGDLYVELGGIAMPFTVYITADGRVVDKHNGPLNEDQLREQISKAFG